MAPINSVGEDSLANLRPLVRSVQPGLALMRMADTDVVDVELLYFDGCPSYKQLLPRLCHLVAEAGGDPQQILVRAVETVEAADELRFLGSPTVRVNGEDVDPSAGTRTDFGLKCRLYRSEEGQSGVPPEEWIRAALHESQSLP